MRILGIETSCDETAAAVVEVARGQFSVLSNVVSSQIKIHAKTGGVVPEVAARAHVEKIIPVIEKALRYAHENIKTLKHESICFSNPQIDAIAVTAGPGLVTSLSVGVEAARTLACLWKKPLVAVNHLAGHLYANWLTTAFQTQHHETVRSHRFVRCSKIEFPALCLIVSGGHTELVLMEKHLDFKIIGSTRDDAAGEAFDKVAKMLGLGYPGGPAVAVTAEKFLQNRHLERPAGVERSHMVNGVEISPLASRLGRNDKVFQFPRPMISSPDFDFSFSGLKTAVLYYIKTLKHENMKTLLSEICYEFQEAVVDVLVSKTIRAAKKYKVKTVLLGGGVAANARLRKGLKCAIAHFSPNVIFNAPCLEYTTDNAAMIAVAGYFMVKAKQFTHWQKLDLDPNWELGELQH